MTELAFTAALIALLTLLALYLQRRAYEKILKEKERDYAALSKAYNILSFELFKLQNPREAKK